MHSKVQVVNGECRAEISFAVVQDRVYNVWPPFSKFCMKQFELVVLDLLYKSGIRLSFEWELSLPL